MGLIQHLSIIKTAAISHRNRGGTHLAGWMDCDASSRGSSTRKTGFLAFYYGQLGFAKRLTGIQADFSGPHLQDNVFSPDLFDGPLQFGHAEFITLVQFGFLVFEGS